MLGAAKVQKTVKAIPRVTLAEAAFEQLIAFVVNGKWKPGDRIPPERELCTQLGIARTSLREALKAMALIGMVDSRVGDGTFVCPRSEFLSRPLLWALTGTDHVELRNIMEARALIEKDLAAMAAERATPRELQNIERAIISMRQAIDTDGSILDADMAFHLAVATAAHNDVLRNAVQLLRNLLRHWISLKLLIPDVPKVVLEQHITIYSAIRANDVAAARQAMWDHLQNTAKLLHQLVGERAERPNARNSGSRSKRANRRQSRS